MVTEKKMRTSKIGDLICLRYLFDGGYRVEIVFRKDLLCSRHAQRVLSYLVIISWDLRVFYEKLRAYQSLY